MTPEQAARYRAYPNSFKLNDLEALAAQSVSEQANRLMQEAAAAEEQLQEDTRRALEFIRDRRSRAEALAHKLKTAIASPRGIDPADMGFLHLENEQGIEARWLPKETEAPPIETPPQTIEEAEDIIEPSEG